MVTFTGKGTTPGTKYDTEYQVFKHMLRGVRTFA